MKYQDIKISKLIEKIDRGQLRLPEMQRGYVWKSKKVSSLLDSLYRSYPSGTILIWETDDGVPTRDFAVERSTSVLAENTGKKFELLLDGQQRLTSLLAILKGRFVTVSDKSHRIDVLFNLKHPEEPEVEDEEMQDKYDSLNAVGRGAGTYDKMTFATSNAALKNKKHWISVSKFFDTSNIEQFLKDAGFNRSDSWFQKYRDRLAKLKGILDYEYRADTLKSSVSYGEVTEIFVRVNSQGTKLKSSDLALAQITAKWPRSLEIFENFAEECKAQGFDFDLGIYIKNLVVFATGQSRFDTIKRISENILKDSWEQSKESMRFSISFLKDNVGIDSSGLLSSPFLAIVVAYYARKLKHELSEAQEANLRRWILLANMKGRYSGSAGQHLDKDLSLIKKDTDSALQRLAEVLEVQFGTFDINVAELRDRKTNSPYFSAMFMAFRESGAKDWHDKTKISFSNIGKQKFEFHHIFPKSVLKDNYSPEQINDIANLAFITARTNGKIGDKEPSDYIKLFDGYENLFAKQCIPTDKHLLELENYEQFLGERRELIAARLNEFVGTENS